MSAPSTSRLNPFDEDESSNPFDNDSDASAEAEAETETETTDGSERTVFAGADRPTRTAAHPAVASVSGTPPPSQPPDAVVERSVSPLSSLLSSLSLSSSLPPDMCDLSGVWRVDRSRSDNLLPLLAALAVPKSSRQLIDAMDVLTTIQHDPLQHTITIVDRSDGGEHTTTLYTDGVVRTHTGQDGKQIVRRALEEREDGHDSASPGMRLPPPSHTLRGGMVRVETQLSGGLGSMVDERVLMDRALMLQITQLHRDNQLIVEIRRFYQKVETVAERAAGAKEWADKLAITAMIAKAKLDRAHHRGEAAEAEVDGEDGEEEWREEESENDEEDTDTEQEHDDIIDEHDEHERDGEAELEADSQSRSRNSLASSTGSSPATSPLPVLTTLAAAAVTPAVQPPVSSLTGRWSVLRLHSQDVSPLLKRLGVSYADRLDARHMEEIVMNLGSQILLSVDRGSAQVRYSIGQWHDNVGFGGKKGKVLVTVDRQPLTVRLECAFLKDRRNKFVQLVEPVHATAALRDFDPRAARPKLPDGFVVCKLVDVRVLETRTVLRQLLQYSEKGVVQVVCVRYLRKIESAAERMRGVQEEQQRQQAMTAVTTTFTTAVVAGIEPKSTIYHRKGSDRMQQHVSDDMHPQAVPPSVEAANYDRDGTSSRALAAAAGDGDDPEFAASIDADEDDSIEPTASSSIRASSVAGPNPLLTFLPVMLVVSRDRRGELYCLLSALALALWCHGNYFGCVTAIAASAFLVHYHEVVRAHRRTTRSRNP